MNYVSYKVCQMSVFYLQAIIFGHVPGSLPVVLGHAQLPHPPAEDPGWNASLPPPP